METFVNVPNFDGWRNRSDKIAILSSQLPVTVSYLDKAQKQRSQKRLFLNDFNC